MGAFEPAKAKASNLPTDVPNAGEAAAEGHADGAIFTSDNRKRYRLRHARWVEVVARQPKAAAAKATAHK